MLKIKAYTYFFFLYSLGYQMTRGALYISRLGKTVSLCWGSKQAQFDSLNLCYSLNSFKISQKRLMWVNTFNKFYYLFPFWTLLFFKGKSFRIILAKKQKQIIFNLGYSHWTNFFYPNRQGLFKLLKKQKILFFTFNLNTYLYFQKIIYSLRTLNHYTLRGLRVRRQFIWKRKRRRGASRVKK